MAVVDLLFFGVVLLQIAAAADTISCLQYEGKGADDGAAIRSAREHANE